MIGASTHRPLQIGLETLTDLGDSAVLLPVSIVFFIWLSVTHPIKLSLTWLLTVVLCNSLIGLLKIYFLTCPAGPSLHSPSGHTGFSILVYGSLTAVLASAMRSYRRAVTIALGAGTIGAIAASRFILDYHSFLEVFVGAVIGCASLAFFVRAYAGSSAKSRWLLPLGFAVIMVAAFFHGEKLRAETYLNDLSVKFGQYAQICAYRH